MLLVKPCHIVLFYLITGNILSSYQFYSGTKRIVWPSRSWTSCVCCFRKEETIQVSLPFKNIRRKTPKYKKKVGLLTLYVGKSINLWRDWWIQMNFWWYSNAKRWVKNVCAPKNSEFQSSEMSDHGLLNLKFFSLSWGVIKE